MPETLPIPALQDRTEHGVTFLAVNNPTDGVPPHWISEGGRAVQVIPPYPGQTSWHVNALETEGLMELRGELVEQRAFSVAVGYVQQC